MKKIVFAFSLFTLIGSSVLIGCKSSADKVESAQEDVKEAKENLTDANNAYLTDLENYRKEEAEKIAANNASVEKFKARIIHDKTTATADYEKRITELEKKNTDMKKKLDDYKADSKESWEQFKTEFNHDMDELGVAFKDLTVKNVK